MNEVINEIRNKVIQKFCRTVLWIDDEIHLDQGLAAEGTPLSLEINMMNLQGQVCSVT